MSATARVAGDKLGSWIEREEGGRRLRLYLDSKGLWTIGIGRCLERIGISDDECDLLFANDLRRAEAAVHRLGPWVAQLDPARRGALVAMAFQLGEAGLRTFRRMLRACAEGDFARAAGLSLESKWAENDSPARARRTAAVLATGDWGMV
jgi:lysozyme